MRKEPLLPAGIWQKSRESDLATLFGLLMQSTLQRRGNLLGMNYWAPDEGIDRRVGAFAQLMKSRRHMAGPLLGSKAILQDTVQNVMIMNVSYHYPIFTWCIELRSLALSS